SRIGTYQHCQRLCFTLVDPLQQQLPLALIQYIGVYPGLILLITLALGLRESCQQRLLVHLHYLPCRFQISLAPALIRLRRATLAPFVPGVDEDDPFLTLEDR